MSETSHARSRRATLYGLVIQLVATIAAIALAIKTLSPALYGLGVFLACGLPVWFVTLLVFRQQELAALEALDLEELRRERETVGASEGMFAADSGFQIARTRLDWMVKWLLPGFGLLSGVLLIVGAAWLFRTIRFALDSEAYQALQDAELGFILLLILTGFLFFYARYAAGLARVPEWQIIRGCGSFMLAAAVAGLAAVVAFGAHIYSPGTDWEVWVAQAIPVLMALLGAETVLNFVLDIYRPKTPGTIPRTCFDSRIVGLFAEPGGLTHSLQEAINYQFGFKVTQTRLFAMVQSHLLGLVLVTVIAIWLLTCIVIVQPYERVIVERFGRQMNAEQPLAPGVHFKLPAPIEVARRYNTEQLHEFVVGYRRSDDVGAYNEDAIPVELWTDEQHAGRDHFNFCVAPIRDQESSPDRAAFRDFEDERSAAKRAPVHMARMAVYVTYRIRRDGLADFTQNADDPHRAIRRIAWEEALRYNAGKDYITLMGAGRLALGSDLKRRIAQQVAAMKLGLEVVYVGAQQVHPVKPVAEAFREYVNAQQIKLAEIRKARVDESKILSLVAGDASLARAMAFALDEINNYEELRSRSLETLGDLNPDLSEVSDLREGFVATIEARSQAAIAARNDERTRSDFELGLGQSRRRIEVAEQALAEARAKLATAERALTEALAARQARLAETRGAAQAEALLTLAQAESGLDYWRRRIAEYMVGLEGDAAVLLSDAQAVRWEREMQTAAEIIRLETESAAYHAAPSVYKVRSYLKVLVEGLGKARKYFLAFEPGTREVRVTFDSQEKARPDLVGTPVSGE